MGRRKLIRRGRQQLNSEEYRRSLAHLYDAYGARVYGYVLSLVTDPGDAEDIVQDTFTKYMDLRRVPDNPVGYLFRMARNEAWSLLRRRRVFFWIGRRMEEQSALLRAVTDERPAGERETLERALRKLPAKQRETIVLKHFEGMTFQEIGQVVECSPHTAASRYRYAIKKLRAALDPEDFEA